MSLEFSKMDEARNNPGEEVQSEPSHTIVRVYVVIMHFEIKIWLTLLMRKAMVNFWTCITSI